MLDIWGIAVITLELPNPAHLLHALVHHSITKQPCNYEVSSGFSAKKDCHMSWAGMAGIATSRPNTDGHLDGDIN